eukprot:TRINITY_DN631_c5_g1_i2.p1 TRINITY_DN631_c5_g1~~TRINITY_DN631_c5_g1_i2.p1  ORF type:complete len:923 (-),score=206.34 TRINITY_DN631_c5_g1_i2:268-3036(-)
MNRISKKMKRDLLFQIFFVILIFYSFDATKNIFHIIPHSHCDAGFVKTFDEYYEEEVRFILSSVTENLYANPSYRFNWAEIGFFFKYWTDNRTTDEMRDKLRHIIENKQMRWAGAGWVQNDEAVAIYTDVIHQMTLGHNFVKKNFGLSNPPNLGWQIDPFGASSSTPVLFDLMGFNATIYRRVNFYDLALYRVNRSLEFHWRGSRALSKNTIFGHLLDDTYSSPLGFDFSHGNNITPENIARKSEELVGILTQRSYWYRTPNVLVPLGGDFEYQDATIMFNNMTLLINYINERSDQFNCVIKYSTLPEYFDEVLPYLSNTSFPDYDTDFLPYTSFLDSWWTGFYTSRPALKIRIRKFDTLLQSAEFLLAYSFSFRQYFPNVNFTQIFEKLYIARNAQGILQHHDAVTGTARQDVVDDYNRRIDIGEQQLAEVQSQTLPLLLVNKNFVTNVTIISNDTYLTNFDSQKTVVLLVQNVLASQRLEILHYYTNEPNLVVKDSNGNVLVSQVTKCINFTLNGLYDLYFYSQLPPLSISTFFVQKGNNKIHITKKENTRKKAKENTLENEFYKVSFDENTGLLSSITNKNLERAYQFQQNFIEYESAEGSAYVFRPTFTILKSKKCSITFTKGNLVEEAYQECAPSVNQTIRLYKNSPYIELTHHARMDGYELNLVATYQTSLNNNLTFWADDSGMQMRPRKYGQFYDTLAANYFPSVSTSFIIDDSTKDQLVFLAERSHGVTSQKNGEYEMMLHRRMGTNGFPPLGLCQPLNDTTSINDTVWVMVGNYNDINKQRHFQMYNLNNRPITSFSLANSISHWTSEHTTDTISPMNDPLPDEIHLVSFMVDDLTMNNNTIVRFHHVYDEYDVSPFNTSVNFAFSNVFPNFKNVSGLTEKTLSLMYDLPNNNPNNVTLTTLSFKSFSFQPKK